MTSLCWKCSQPQGFYENPCPHCGATNPNVDLDRALSECDERRPGDEPVTMAERIAEEQEYESGGQDV